MTATLHILLPVHNRRETTARFVQALKRQSYQNYHLILIDDGSRDGTAALVTGEIGAATVIAGDGTLWWGGALQAGYDYLEARPETHEDFVLIMNDDTVFDPDFLGLGVGLLQQRLDTLLLAHCYSQQSGELLDSGTEVRWRTLTFAPAATPERVNCLSTRGLFLRVADFMKTGGFRPRLLPHYGSDYEFSIRAARKGLRLEAHPDLKLWVDEERTGHHDVLGERSLASLARLFSTRTVANPLRWSVFVLLACPWRWKALSLLRVWWGGSKLLLCICRQGVGRGRR